MDEGYSGNRSPPNASAACVMAPFSRADAADKWDDTTHEVLNAVAAALAFNELSLWEGYTAFDADGDGRVSFSDFLCSLNVLQMEISKHDSKIAFQSLDVEGSGFIPQSLWVQALGGRMEAVLRSTVKGLEMQLAAERSRHEAAELTWKNTAAAYRCAALSHNVRIHDIL